jgi:hypothetical protein
MEESVGRDLRKLPGNVELKIYCIDNKNTKIIKNKNLTETSLLIKLIVFCATSLFS